MKTKQTHIKAVITGTEYNGTNLSNKMETAKVYQVIDKKTERVVVECYVYVGRSKNSSTVKSTLWVHQMNGESCSGSGNASGWGYDKESAAIGNAVTNAGIELFGDIYSRESKPNFKNALRMHGTGVIEKPLLAIAYAAGCKDAIFVK